MNQSAGITCKGQVVIVVGMHRSGTSLMSIILNKMGVNFGNNLLSATYANPYGHFEDNYLIQENESILRLAGGAWDAPPSSKKINDAWDQSESHINNYISRLGQNKGILGIKEPRMSLMLPQYLNLLRNCKIIYVKRDCQEIANSIYVRNKINTGYSKKLCEYYNKEIQNGLNKFPNLSLMTVNYNELKERRAEVVIDVADFLNIYLKKDQVESIASIIKNKKILAEESKKYINNRALFLKSIMQPQRSFEVGANIIRRYWLRQRWKGGK